MNSQKPEPPLFNEAEWPKDPTNNRLLCAPKHPMPHPNNNPNFDRQLWAHTNVRWIRDGDYHDTYQCVDCGHTYTVELPE